LTQIGILGLKINQLAALANGLDHQILFYRDFRTLEKNVGRSVARYSEAWLMAEVFLFPHMMKTDIVNRNKTEVNRLFPKINENCRNNISLAMRKCLCAA
jgi:hypothetical protein